MFLQKVFTRVKLVKTSARILGTYVLCKKVVKSFSFSNSKQNSLYCTFTKKASSNQPFDAKRKGCTSYSKAK